MNTVKLILNTNKVFKKFNKKSLNTLIVNIYHDTPSNTDKKYNIDIMRITNNIIYNIFENYTTNLDDSINLIIDYLINAKSVLADSTLIKIINKALLYNNKDIINILKRKIKRQDMINYLDHVNASEIINHIPEPVVGGPVPPTPPKAPAGQTATVTTPSLVRPSSEQIAAAAVKARGQKVAAVTTLPGEATPPAPGVSVVTPAGQTATVTTPSLVRPSLEQIAAAAAAVKARGQKAAVTTLPGAATPPAPGASGVTPARPSPPAGQTATVTSKLLPKESLSEKIAAEAAARAERVAKAVKDTEDSRAKKNLELGLSGKETELPNYVGKRVQKKGSKKVGRVVKLNKVNPIGTYLTIRYDGSRNPTSGELLSNLIILPNTQNPVTAQPAPPETQPLSSATATPAPAPARPRPSSLSGGPQSSSSSPKAPEAQRIIKSILKKPIKTIP
jgi:hypothetical protein